MHQSHWASGVGTFHGTYIYAIRGYQVPHSLH